MPVGTRAPLVKPVRNCVEHGDIQTIHVFIYIIFLVRIISFFVQGNYVLNCTSAVPCVCTLEYFKL